ncbi:MAG: tRNA guanosine(34) transglycosylase Tgt, partial [Gammaproteobacteria bacterium]
MSNCHMQFEIKAADGKARAGAMQFPRGEVATCVLLTFGRFL